MAAFVALLRGINVGGKNILPMQKLRELLGGLGCQDVATVIQSGNAVFKYSADAADLSLSISSSIESKFGFRPSVIVLTEDEFSNARHANPFTAESVDKKYLHIWFMRESAATADLARMDELAVSDEKFLLTEAAFYLHAPSGIGRSRLAGEVEKCLGVAATARNWRTVGKISDLLETIGG